MSLISGFALRKPCSKCGFETGFILTVNGQDVVRCEHCQAYQYNAPRVETGRKPRTVQTVHELITPAIRSRMIDRANSRCERCGKHAAASKTGLHVGHIISVDEGLRQGLDISIINSDENLICECDECNLGHGKGVLPVRFVVALLLARLNQGASNEG